MRLFTLIVSCWFISCWFIQVLQPERPLSRRPQAHFARASVCVMRLPAAICYYQAFHVPCILGSSRAVWACSSRCSHVPESNCECHACFQCHAGWNCHASWGICYSRKQISRQCSLERLQGPAYSTTPQRWREVTTASRPLQIPAHACPVIGLEALLSAQP